MGIIGGKAGNGWWDAFDEQPYLERAAVRPLPSDDELKAILIRVGLASNEGGMPAAIVALREELRKVLR